METINHALLTFLLNSLWQVPLVAAVAWLGSKVLRNGPASHWHAIWAAAMITALVLPLASIGTGGARAAGVQLIPPPDTSAPVVPSRLIPPALQRSSPPPQLALPKRVAFERIYAVILLVGYLLFLSYRLAVLTMAFIRTGQIRRKSEIGRPSALVEKVWNRAAGALGVPDAELRISARISGPVMAGGWRKTIILPESLLNETSEDVLAAAIGHEMAHIARHDFQLKILFELLWLPVAFHPAAAWIRRGIERTRELACDDLVTQRLLDPEKYASSLIAIAAAMTGLRFSSPPGPGYALGVFDGDVLEERMKRLTERRPATGVPQMRRARLLLATGLSALTVCAVIASGLAVSARAQSVASPEMKLAEAAFNGGDFKGAVEHFRNAVNLDPGNVNARLFLANAIVKVAQLESPDAPPILQYQEVLARDPNNKTAIFALAAFGGPELWQQTHDRLIRLIVNDPKNGDAYYTAGVLDWNIVHQGEHQAFAAAGVPPAGQLPDPGARKALRDKYQPLIEESFRMLQLALQLDPERPDALAYLNLLYRSDAYIADTPEDYNALIAKGDVFVGRALTAQRARAARVQSAGPAPLSVDDAPTVGPPLGSLPPPPPPPPPPPGMPNAR